MVKSYTYWPVMSVSTSLGHKSQCPMGQYIKSAKEWIKPKSIRSSITIIIRFN